MFDVELQVLPFCAGSWGADDPFTDQGRRAIAIRFRDVFAQTLRANGGSCPGSTFMLYCQRDLFTSQAAQRLYIIATQAGSTVPRPVMEMCQAGQTAAACAIGLAPPERCANTARPHMPHAIVSVFGLGDQLGWRGPVNAAEVESWEPTSVPTGAPFAQYMVGPPRLTVPSTGWSKTVRGLA